MDGSLGQDSFENNEERYDKLILYYNFFTLYFVNILIYSAVNTPIICKPAKCLPLLLH